MPERRGSSREKPHRCPSYEVAREGGKLLLDHQTAGERTLSGNHDESTTKAVQLEKFRFLTV